LEWMAQISWPDLLAIIILLRSGYVGSQRGFFGELFHIFGMCAALFLAVFFYIPVSGFFNRYLFIPVSISYLLGFISILFFFYIVIKVAYGLMGKILKIEVIPGINKIGGLLLGLSKGIVLATLLFFAMLLTPIEYVFESAKERSLLAPFFVNAGVGLYQGISGVFSRGETGGEIERLISGVNHLHIKKLKLKRKDNLDEFLD